MDTPLIGAACHGQTSEVASLLAAGAAVDEANRKGTTPLLIACQNGHTEIVETLIAANAVVNQARDGGFTPLYIACEKGHTEVCLLYTSPSPRDQRGSRMPSSA